MQAFTSSEPPLHAGFAATTVLGTPRNFFRTELDEVSESTSPQCPPRDIEEKVAEKLREAQRELDGDSVPVESAAGGEQSRVPLRASGAALLEWCQRHAAWQDAGKVAAAGLFGRVPFLSTRSGVFPEESHVTKIIQQTPELHTLDLSHVAVSESTLSLCRNLCHLRSLTLCAVSLNEREAALISGLHKLQYLNMSRANSVLVDFSALRDLRALILRSLDLDSAGKIELAERISGVSADGEQVMPLLEYLDVGKCHLEDEHLTRMQLGRRTKLLRFNADACVVDLALLPPQLEVLSVSDGLLYDSASCAPALNLSVLIARNVRSEGNTALRILSSLDLGSLVKLDLSSVAWVPAALWETLLGDATPFLSAVSVAHNPLIGDSAMHQLMMKPCLRYLNALKTSVTKDCQFRFMDMRPDVALLASAPMSTSEAPRDLSRNTVQCMMEVAELGFDSCCFDMLGIVGELCEHFLIDDSETDTAGRSGVFSEEPLMAGIIAGTQTLLARFPDSSEMEDAVARIFSHFSGRNVARTAAQCRTSIRILATLLRSSDANVLSSAASACWNLCGTDDLKLYANRVGVIPLLVRGMSLSLGIGRVRHLQLAQNCGGALANLAVHEECRDAILQCGAVGETLRMLQLSTDLGKLICLNLLCNLAVSTPARDMIHDMGAVPDIVKLMAAENDRISSEATACVWNLSVSAENKRIIRESGGVGILCTRLERLRGGGLQHVLGALSNMANEEESRQELRGTNAIPRLLFLTVRHVDLSIREHAASALWNMSVDEETVDILCKQDGLPGLIPAISSDTPVLCERVLGILSNCGFHSDRHREIIIDTFLERVNACLREWKEGQLLRSALAMLWNVSVAEGASSKLADAGARETLLAMLSSRDQDVIYNVCGILANMCSFHQENRAQIGSHVRAIVAQLKACDGEALRQVCSLLWNLTVNNVENKRLIRDAGALPRLVELLHHPQDRIREKASGTLVNLASLAANQQAIVDAGALEPLVALLTDENVSVRENCAWALKNISADSTNVRKQVLAIGGVEQIVTLLRAAARVYVERSAAQPAGAQAGTPSVSSKGFAGLWGQQTYGEAPALVPRRDAAMDDANESTLKGVMEQTSACLWNLSALFDNKRKLGSLGAVQTLLWLAASSVVPVVVRENAMGCLSNVTSDVDENRHILLKNRGLDILAQILLILNHKDSKVVAESIQLIEHAGSVCWSMSVNESLRERMLEHGLTSALINVVIKYQHLQKLVVLLGESSKLKTETCLDVVSNAIGALSNLVTCEKNCKEVVSKCLSQIVALVVSSNANIQKNAVWTLCNIANTSGFEQCVFESGAVPSLFQVARSPDSRVRNISFSTLGALIRFKHLASAVAHAWVKDLGRTDLKWPQHRAYTDRSISKVLEQSASHSRRGGELLEKACSELIALLLSYSDSRRIPILDAVAIMGGNSLEMRRVCVKSRVHEDMWGFCVREYKRALDGASATRGKPHRNDAIFASTLRALAALASNDAQIAAHCVQHEADTVLGGLMKEASEWAADAVDSPTSEYIAEVHNHAASLLGSVVAMDQDSVLTEAVGGISINLLNLLGSSNSTLQQNASCTLANLVLASVKASRALSSSASCIGELFKNLALPAPVIHMNVAITIANMMAGLRENLSLSEDNCKALATCVSSTEFSHNCAAILVHASALSRADSELEATPRHCQMLLKNIQSGGQETKLFACCALEYLLRERPRAFQFFVDDLRRPQNVAKLLTSVSAEIRARAVHILGITAERAPRTVESVLLEDGRPASGGAAEYIGCVLDFCGHFDLSLRRSALDAVFVFVRRSARLQKQFALRKLHNVVHASLEEFTGDVGAKLAGIGIFAELALGNCESTLTAIDQLQWASHTKFVVDAMTSAHIEMQWRALKTLSSLIRLSAKLNPDTSTWFGRSAEELCERLVAAAEYCTARSQVCALAEALGALAAVDAPQRSPREICNAVMRSKMAREAIRRAVSLEGYEGSASAGELARAFLG